jgi:hypothetical protein
MCFIRPDKASALPCPACSPRPQTDDLSTREAVVLDMGQYEYAAMATAAAAAVAAAAASTGPASTRNTSWADGEEPTLEHLHRLRTLSIARMREEPSGKRSRMRLYQVRGLLGVGGV